jgi:Ca2+-binding RTX toxin-like protein
VIDLSVSHTGVTLTAFNASTTTTFFDLDSTGFAQQTAWTSGTTGLLVRDLNSNGIIDNGNELFGSATVDGFTKLAQLDSNHDLKIDSHDSDWSSLQIWIDANGDGVTDSGELHTLASENIVSIDLAGVTSSTSTIDGNTVSHTSTVTFNSGATAAIDDVWFQHSTANTVFVGDYTLDTDTLSMVTLRGYGTVADLTVSMSQDSTLKGMVSDFVSGVSYDTFADPSTLDSDISSILYRWAGVDGVDTDARGPNVNAQDLEFLEHFFGHAFSQWGNADPQNDAGAEIETAWRELHDSLKADLLVQAGVNSLFDSPITYDTSSGTLTGTIHLSESAISDLATHAPGTDADAQAFWVSVADFINNTEGISNLDMDEHGWLDSAVTGTTSVGWDDIVSTYNHENPGLTINGTSGNDTLNGGSGDDTITGDGGTDTIHGNAGNDTITDGTGSASTIYGDDGDDLIWGSTGAENLYGGNGSDTIHGGGGADIFYAGAGGNFLYGGSGNDTYVFGGGDDVITEASGTDVINLPSGLTSGDITFTRVSSDGSTSQFNDLLITVADGGGSIQIVDHFLSSGYQVETLHFYDTSTINLASLTTADYAVVLTGGDDTWNPGLNTNQVVKGMDGNDSITTGSGNDTIDGGNGNDTMYGGSGNDTYIASPGFDAIHESSGTDVINIPAGYTLDDVTFSRVGSYDLMINIVGLGEIQVVNQFYSSDYMRSRPFTSWKTAATRRSPIRSFRPSALRAAIRFTA